VIATVAKVIKSLVEDVASVFTIERFQCETAGLFDFVAQHCEIPSVPLRLHGFPVSGQFPGEPRKNRQTAGRLMAFGRAEGESGCGRAEVSKGLGNGTREFLTRLCQF
jgi:hypothetical protein